MRQGDSNVDIENVKSTNAAIIQSNNENYMQVSQYIVT